MGTAESEYDLRQLNERLNYWEKYYLVEILKSFPVHIELPTGERCNVQCVFCLDRSDEQKNKYTDFTFAEVKKMAELLPLRFCSTLNLYSWGEPFFNKDYEQIFDYITNNFPGICISISTNGTLLNGKWAEKLISHGNIMLNVSLNAASRETYKRVMQRDLFEAVRENINRLVSMKRETGADKLIISLSFVAIKDNIDELPLFIELAHRFSADEVVVQDMFIIDDKHKHAALHDEPELARRFFAKATGKAKELGINFCSYVTYPVEYFKQEEQSAADNFCYDPWQSFKVASNGDVGMCCRSDKVMGNIFEQGFQEIWNGDYYRYYRRTVNTANPPDECRICPVKTGCG